jgi:hypothetical protein
VLLLYHAPPSKKIKLKEEKTKEMLPPCCNLGEQLARRFASQIAKY